MALRLMIWLLLRGKWGAFVAHFGVVCSTWTAINQPTSQRDELLPWGAEYRPSVFSANKMVSRPGMQSRLRNASRGRVALLTYLVSAMEGVFLIENPRESRLLLCPHLREAFRNMHRWGVPVACLPCFLLFGFGCIGEVWKTTFYMRKFGSRTPKPTFVLSNSTAIASLDLGPLTKQEAVIEEADRTTRPYIDSRGIKRYHGTKALKQTQPPSFKNEVAFVTKDLPFQVCHQGRGAHPDNDMSRG